MKIRRAKSRFKIATSCLIALVCVVGIGFSGFKIYEWITDSIDTSNQTDRINDATSTREISDDANTEVVSTGEPDDAPYWKYLKMNLIDVDFDELRKINDETAGWIQVSGTNINYPYVKTSNNDFYLKHSFDKSYNVAGWVFEDFRNKNDGSDKNTILYAHGRNDGSMFGTLRTILVSGWLAHPDNFTVRTATDTESSLWQVFSVYRIEVTTDYIQTNFSSERQFQNFVDMLKNRSAKDFNTTVSGSDKILTLSTCYNSKERVVLHAKLIKRQPKQQS